MLLKSNKDNQIGNYQFNVNGGAVGSIDTGVILPKNNLVTSIYFKVSTPFTSAGGLATVSVGVRSLDLSVPVVNSTLFLSASLASGLPAPFLAFVGNIPTPLPAVILLAGYMITFSIGVEPLTGGSLMMYCDYFNSDVV